MMLRVVIAEDHALMREGVRSLLETSAETSVVASVATAAELLEAVARIRPDAVLTDIRMPGGTGIEAARQIRHQWPDVGVVVLSQYLDGVYARELFANGSAGLGYLLKERVGRPQELIEALRVTAAGGSVVDPRVVDLLVGSQAAASPVSALTQRERDVLALMATGLSNPTIAERLHLSLSSVEKHVSSIFSALGLAEPEPTTHRRVAAVIQYLQEAGPR